VTPTDLTFAEAMSFVVSIGALGPDTLAFSAPPGMVPGGG
jgi:hypothetical protein